MPQNVPSFEFSDRAKQVRAFVFDFWCEHGRGPTLREVHDATELDRRRIIQAYKELQLGIVITVDENTQNCNLLKAPPFSSYPSQVRDTRSFGTRKRAPDRSNASLRGEA